MYERHLKQRSEHCAKDIEKNSADDSQPIESDETVFTIGRINICKRQFNSKHLFEEVLFYARGYALKISVAVRSYLFSQLK